MLSEVVPLAERHPDHPDLNLRPWRCSCGGIREVTCSYWPRYRVDLRCTRCQGVLQATHLALARAAARHIVAYPASDWTLMTEVPRGE